jgi:hypothetical protein
MRPPIVFREGERKAKQNTGALDPTRNIGLGPFFFVFGVAFLLLLVYATHFNMRPPYDKACIMGLPAAQGRSIESMGREQRAT